MSLSLTSFSEMDKAKVLEIIEPSSEVVEGKVSVFDARKIRTDSLDDADEMFPDKEVFHNNNNK